MIIKHGLKMGLLGVPLVFGMAVLAGCDSSSSSDDDKKKDALRGDAYYHVANPNTNNEQLLAYNIKQNKVFTVNSDVVLATSNKMFLSKGKHNADGSKTYASRSAGIYLDPSVEKEVRKYKDPMTGKDVSYNFFKDSKLKIFSADKPKQAKDLFSSADIPKKISDKGLKKLGKSFFIVENISDTKNSYVSVKAFESLADNINHESSSVKKQSYVSFKISDKTKKTDGKVLAIIEDSDGKTDKVLVQKSGVHTPKNADGTYALYITDKDLANATKLSDGRFHLIGQTNKAFYFLKVGDNKIYALVSGGTSLKTLSTGELAGNFDPKVHIHASSHGGTSSINAFTSLSIPTKFIADGDTGYFAFYYDLQPLVGYSMFGKFGAFKSAQIFKLSTTTATKIYDNQDGTDDSSSPKNSEHVNGHVSLVGVGTKGGNKQLIVERAWYDGNDTFGGSCKASMMKGCLNLEYGLINLSTSSSVDTLTSFDTPLKKEGLTYYVSKRMTPFIMNDKLFISLQGNAKYTYDTSRFDINTLTSPKKFKGRTYFTQSKDVKDSFKLSGKAIVWDKIASKISIDGGDTFGIDAKINDKNMISVSAEVNGLPLAGFSQTQEGGNNIINLGMFRTNKSGAGHGFDLFMLDVENKKTISVEYKPYSSWIYR